MACLAIILALLSTLTSLSCACEYARYGSDHTMCIYTGNGCSISKRGLNDQEREAILKAHNDYRQKIATGQQSGQPKASNMKQLKWDNELATIAQRLVDQCKMEHDQNRRSHKYSYAGQNLYMSWSSTPSNANFANAVKAWYDEVHEFNSQNVRRFRFVYSTGHYTQLLWAETEAVGCGSASFRDRNGWYAHLIGCNYGPGGNMMGSEMYKIGEPCTHCDSGCSSDYNGLCA